MIQIPDSTNWPMLDAAKVADWVASVSDERIAALIGGMPLPGFLREQRDEMVATVKTALRRQAASPPPDRMHSDHDINRNPIAVAGPYLNSSSSVRPQGPAIASVNSMLPLPGPPNSLLTPADAARRLGCSVKTLAGHVASGALRYVIIGHGRKRPRRMFTDADLDDFIANQTRKDSPCPSTRTETAARRISTSTSKCEVIGFTARRNARRGAKPKK